VLVFDVWASAFKAFAMGVSEWVSWKREQIDALYPDSEKHKLISKVTYVCIQRRNIRAR